MASSYRVHEQISLQEQAREVLQDESNVQPVVCIHERAVISLEAD